MSERGLVTEIRIFTDDTMERVRAYLATPEGRRLLSRTGRVLVLGSPLLFRLPIIKRYPLLRILEIVGGAAALIKLGEFLRDWEPGSGDGPKRVTA
jgi:hypothetical protein